MSLRWRWISGLVIVALVIAGAYIAGSGPQSNTVAADPNEADTADFDFEASTVVLRQMDAEGRQLYQINAAHVTQAPQQGTVSATDLSMHYDPPQSPADGSQRWTLTAQSARLPEDNDLVELQGRVRVRGKPEGGDAVATFTTERMDYNIKTQDISTDQPVELHWGSNRLSGASGLRANIKQGTVELESEVHGHILP